MARDNRSSAVRGYRDTPDSAYRRRVEREVENTIRDGMRILRLVCRGVYLTVCYHERGETEGAFALLKHGAEGLVESGRRLGLSDRGIEQLIIEPIAGELESFYDGPIIDRLMQALRRCAPGCGPIEPLAPRAHPRVNLVSLH
jgi:hypothetical protein